MQVGDHIFYRLFIRENNRHGAHLPAGRVLGVTATLSSAECQQLSLQVPIVAAGKAR